MSFEVNKYFRASAAMRAPRKMDGVRGEGNDEVLVEGGRCILRLRSFDTTMNLQYLQRSFKAFLSF